MIYLSLTTTPSRIKYFLEFYNNIISGSVQPDKIILNVYSKSLFRLFCSINNLRLIYKKKNI